MPLTSGQQLSQYRLAEKIGEGGMGVVWKAQDTALGRDAAIKVLPEALGADPERLGRLEREARLLATLNHPHIAAIYGLHEHEGQRFLAMELVPGEDLSTHLARGPLALDQALEIAAQIAEALEAAHEQGVIHRDLKPANVRLTPAGKVKVLDFGLAKALDPAGTSSSPGSSLSPTLTVGTLAGVILGTAAYMSPEQARGRAAGKRADVWALGAVLFEMLSGRRAFEGETVSDTLASVLKSDPDWEALPPSTPAAVKRLLQRCLIKDPDRRLPDIASARFLLREAVEGTWDTGGDALAAQAAAPVSRTAPALRYLPWFLLLLAAAALLALMARPAPAPPAVTRLAVPFPQGATLDPNLQTGIVAISPDGRQIALLLGLEEQRRIYLRSLDSGEAVLLAGTEAAQQPMFSPDGRWIAFFAGGKLKKIAVAGGPPITLCECVAETRGASWSTDGFIVFTPHWNDPLLRVADAGGTPEPLTVLDAETGERSHRWPFAVAGEDLILFTVGTTDSPEAYDGARIDALRPSTGERHTVFEGASMAMYTPSGHLLLGREGNLFAIPFDLRTLTTSGTLVPVLQGVTGFKGSGSVHAAFSRDGTLVYLEGQQQVLRASLSWRYLDGRSERLDLPPGGYGNPRLAPDGSRLAFSLVGESSNDIWVYRFDDGLMTRLTFTGDNGYPIWSPDSATITFDSIRDGKLTSVYRKPADGSGDAELLYQTDVRRPGSGATTPESWSPDGLWLALQASDQDGTNIVMFSPANDEQRDFDTSPGTELSSTFSPDGRWLAYVSDAARGEFQVYLRPFPGPGGQRQISVDGGMEPRWSLDGRILYFRSRAALMAVDMDTSSGLRAGRPRVAIDKFNNLFQVSSFRYFDVHPDGDRFLLLQPEGNNTTIDRATVVLNWFEELKKNAASR